MHKWSIRPASLQQSSLSDQRFNLTCITRRMQHPVLRVCYMTHGTRAVLPADNYGSSCSNISFCRRAGTGMGRQGQQHMHIFRPAAYASLGHIYSIPNQARNTMTMLQAATDQQCRGAVCLAETLSSASACQAGQMKEPRAGAAPCRLCRPLQGGWTCCCGGWWPPASRAAAGGLVGCLGRMAQPSGPPGPASPAGP